MATHNARPRADSAGGASAGAGEGAARGSAGRTVDHGLGGIARSENAAQRIFRVAALMVIWGLAWIMIAQILQKLLPFAMQGPGPGAPGAPGWAALAVGGVLVALCAGRVLGRAPRLRVSDARMIMVLLAVGGAAMAVMADGQVADVQGAGGQGEGGQGAGPARLLTALAPLFAVVTFRLAPAKGR